jgi:hypothetical protein
MKANELQINNFLQVIPMLNHTLEERVKLLRDTLENL